MKYLLPLTAGLMIATSIAAVEANAGPFDRIRGAVKDVKETAEDVEDVAETVDNVSNGRGLRPSSPGSTSASPRSARPKNHAGRAGPAPASLTNLTNCASLQLSNVMIGTGGDYTFSQGLSQEKRSGFLNRQNVTPSGCIIPSMGSGDYLYAEVNEKQYKSMGNSDDWEMQCVESDTKKSVGGRGSEHPYSIGQLSGKDILLHCGNSEGITECASGSNRSRSTAYQKKLKQRGTMMIAVAMPSYHLDNGTDYYCQWYNKPSGTSAFAFQYRRGPVS